MKINISLTTKITIVFLFTFILLIFAFFSFHKMGQIDQHKSIVKYYENITSHIMKNRLDKYEVIEYLTTSHFSTVKNARDVLREIDAPVIRKRGFEVIVSKDRFYIHIIAPHFRILFLDTDNKIQKQYTHLIVFTVVTMLFIAIYLLILKNIRDTNLLLHSRQLFLRTIMHELKTPIAKGKIVSELIDDEKQKTRISHIFDKLNFLIDDFAKVEQVVSQNFSTNLQTYTISEIIEYACEILMIDNIENKVTLLINADHTIKADIDLMALSIKNLLDNGIKYSLEHKIIVEYKNNELLFISQGRRLPKPLNEYFKPFHNDTIGKNHGMGLGLYIVNEILTIHNFTLEYQYQNKKNIFKIIF